MRGNFIVYAKIVPSFTMTEFIEEKIENMTDTRITTVCKEGEDHITDISFTAERNYTPIFMEAFSTQEKPLSVHLISEKDILSENAAKRLPCWMAKEQWHFKVEEEFDFFLQHQKSY